MCLTLSESLVTRLQKHAHRTCGEKIDGENDLHVAGVLHAGICAPVLAQRPFSPDGAFLFSS